MKTNHAAYVAVVVFFRVAAVCAVLLGVFMVAAPVLLTGFSASLLLLRVLLVYLGAALLLWILSKPIASLVVRGIDEPMP